MQLLKKLFFDPEFPKGKNNIALELIICIECQLLMK